MHPNWLYVAPRYLLWAPKKNTNRQTVRLQYQSTMIDIYIHKRRGDDLCTLTAINTQTPLADRPGSQISVVLYPRLAARLTGERVIGGRLEQWLAGPVGIYARVKSSGSERPERRNDKKKTDYS